MCSAPIGCATRRNEGVLLRSTMVVGLRASYYTETRAYDQHLVEPKIIFGLRLISVPITQGQNDLDSLP